MSDQAPKNGTFCWTELTTPDVGAATEFYSRLLGWEATAFPGDMPYTVFKNGDEQVAGMMAPTPEMGDVPPHWMPYITVEDCDDTAAKVEELGGKISVPPTDIPSVGRFCAVTDPTGANICFIAFPKG